MFTLAGFFQCQFILVYRSPKNNSWVELISCLSYSTLSVLCLYPHSCWEISMCTWTPKVLHLPPNFCHCWSVLILNNECGPTHKHSHMLDLLGYTGTPTNLQYLALKTSDHHTMVFSVIASLPRQCLRRIITFRNMKTVSSQDLSIKIAAHLAKVSPDPLPDDLVAHYNTALAHSLDSLAPIKTFNHSAPWFITELQVIKTAGLQDHDPPPLLSLSKIRMLFSTINKLF